MIITKEIASFVGNQDGVKEGRLSPDLTHVVSGGEQDSKPRGPMSTCACLHMLTCGFCLAIFCVLCLVLPPLPSSLPVSIGMDGTVRVYDAILNSAMFESRNRGIKVKIPPKITLFGHMGAVRTVCISPDSWRIVTSGDDGTLRIWDLGGTGTPQKLGHALACGGISYGPYGELVATCGFEGTLKLWDGREGLFIKDICKRDVQYLRCALSPDALRLATANEDGVIRVYDVERGEPVITQRQAFVRARAVTYSRGQGFNLATGSDDGWVKIWEASSGELKCQLDAHIRPVEEGKPKKYWCILDIAYHPSNIRMATCSDDMTIKYWARKFSSSLAANLLGTVTEAEMPDEDELVEAKRKRLMESRRRERLEEMSEEERLARQRRKEKEMKSKIANRQMKHLAGAEPDEFSDSDSDDSLLTEDDIMQIEKALYEDDDDEIEQQNISADPQKWQLVCTLYGHKAAVTSVAFTHAGDRCLSASEDGTIRAWTADIELPDVDVDAEDVSDLPDDAKQEFLKIKKEAAKKKDAGFGAQCVGKRFNECLVVIDVRGGMVRQIAITPDDALLFAASDGLGGWGDAGKGGLVTIWDVRGYHRAGTFETYHPAISVAATGEAPYCVTAADKGGHVYICRYGCQEPHVPKDTRPVPPPNRPSGFCTIL